MAAPLLALLGFIGQPTQGLWAHLAGTVLPEYLRNSALLCLGVGVGTLALGAGAGWLVTMYRFPGQRMLNWALVLPLAMPAYVLAYAYTDFLQVSGPLQTHLRELTGWGWRDYWFPNIRSLGGAIFVLTAALYPYVYVLARAGFAEQSLCALEVSRTLGCTPMGAFRRVGLPLARPAIAAGLAFVMMETLADFGAVAYFELRTFTTGIYRAWYALGSPAAAAQLASLLLLMVFAVLVLEWAARGRGRFSTTTTHIFQKHRVTSPAGAAGRLHRLLAPGRLRLRAARHRPRDHGAGCQRRYRLRPPCHPRRQHRLLGVLASVLIVAVAIAALLAANREASGRRAACCGRRPSAMPSRGGHRRRPADRRGRLRPHRGRPGPLVTGSGTGLVLSGTLSALLYAYLVRFFAVGFNPLEAGMAKIGPASGRARVLGCGPTAVAAASTCRCCARP